MSDVPQVLKFPNPGIGNTKLKQFKWKRQSVYVASLHQTDEIRNWQELLRGFLPGVSEWTLPEIVVSLPA